MQPIRDTIHLADGRVCTLRPLCQEDAPRLLRYLRAVCAETPYLLCAPGDLPQNAAALYAKLLPEDEGARAAVFVAVDNSRRIVGHGVLSPVSAFHKLRHRARAEAAVLRACWGRGIGTMLGRMLIAAARDAGYRQIETAAVSENTGALRLLKRLEFIQSDTVKNALLLEEGACMHLIQFQMSL